MPGRVVTGIWTGYYLFRPEPADPDMQGIPVGQDVMFCPGNKPLKNIVLCAAQIAIDRLVFDNLAAEALHYFEPGKALLSI
jgi:hypothetical protein